MQTLIYLIISIESMSATGFVALVSLWILLSYDEDGVNNCMVELSPLTKKVRQLLYCERIG